jgi:hypothetical protein
MTFAREFGETPAVNVIVPAAWFRIIAFAAVVVPVKTTAFANVIVPVVALSIEDVALKSAAAVEVTVTVPLNVALPIPVFRIRPVTVETPTLPATVRVAAADVRVTVNEPVPMLAGSSGPAAMLEPPVYVTFTFVVVKASLSDPALLETVPRLPIVTFAPVTLSTPLVSVNAVAVVPRLKATLPSADRPRFTVPAAPALTVIPLVTVTTLRLLYVVDTNVRLFPTTTVASVYVSAAT